MRFYLRDYSEHFYRDIEKSALPQRREGKFIQVRNHAADEEYLVLSPRGLSTYHANIAERFFAKKGITGRYNQKRDYFELSPSAWEIVGGGMWEVDSAACTLRLFGSSQAYGRYEPAGLADRVRGKKEFHGYEIQTA